jgi:hypothetical protein
MTAGKKKNCEVFSQGLPALIPKNGRAALKLLRRIPSYVEFSRFEHEAINRN